MGKKEIIIGALVLVILLGITYLATQMATSQQPATSSTNTTALADAKKKFNKNAFYYFWGDGCPHCAELNKWLGEQSWGKTVKVTKLEVWKNTDNAALMQVAADICKLQPEGMGVPFVYYKGQCSTGTPDAEAVFMQAAKDQGLLR